MFQQALDKVSKQVLIRDRYDNFIGGKWVAPVEGPLFRQSEPDHRQEALRESPRSSAADIELALDAAHKAKDAWGKTSVAERSRILNKIADKLEANLELLALVETLDNGKPIRETTYADMPLVVDHWRYFAGVVRAQEGGISEIDPRHRRLSLPRAARRRRPDHSVEFPDADGDLEAGAGARRRQLRRAEARRADAARHPRGDGADRRPAAARRAQRRQRLRRRGRQAAGAEQAHRQDRLHRRDDDGPADHAIRLREHHPGDAGTRRQVAEHLLRRRDGRGRRFLRQGARRLRHVRAQPGRGLHLPEPRAGSGIDLRQVHGARGRAHQEDQAGPPARRRRR